MTDKQYKHFEKYKRKKGKSLNQLMADSYTKKGNLFGHNDYILFTPVGWFFNFPDEYYDWKLSDRNQYISWQNDRAEIVAIILKIIMCTLVSVIASLITISLVLFTIK